MVLEGQYRSISHVTTVPMETTKEAPYKGVVTSSITENVPAGATTLKLADVSGLSVGMLLTISDNQNSETKTIVAVNSDSSRRLSFRRLDVSGSVTLDGALQYSYRQGTQVTATPQETSTTLPVTFPSSKSTPLPVTFPSSKSTTLAVTFLSSQSTSLPSLSPQEQKEGPSYGLLIVLPVASASGVILIVSLIACRARWITRHRNQVDNFSEVMPRPLVASTSLESPESPNIISQRAATYQANEADESTLNVPACSRDEARKHDEKEAADWVAREAVEKEAAEKEMARQAEERELARQAEEQEAEENNELQPAAVNATSEEIVPETEKCPKMEIESDKTSPYGALSPLLSKFGPPNLPSRLTRGEDKALQPSPADSTSEEAMLETESPERPKMQAESNKTPPHGTISPLLGTAEESPTLPSQATHDEDKALQPAPVDATLEDAVLETESLERAKVGVESDNTSPLDTISPLPGTGEQSPTLPPQVTQEENKELQPAAVEAQAGEDSTRSEDIQGCDLYFDLNYDEVNPDVVKSEVMNELGRIGVAEDDLRALSLEVRRGSVIVKIIGPAAFIRNIERLPLRSVTVQSCRASLSRSELNQEADRKRLETGSMREADCVQRQAPHQQQVSPPEEVDAAFLGTQQSCDSGSSRELDGSHHQSSAHECVENSQMENMGASTYPGRIRRQASQASQQERGSSPKNMDFATSGSLGQRDSQSSRQSDRSQHDLNPQQCEENSRVKEDERQQHDSGSHRPRLGRPPEEVDIPPSSTRQPSMLGALLGSAEIWQQRNSGSRRNSDCGQLSDDTWRKADDNADDRESRYLGTVVLSVQPSCPSPPGHQADDSADDGENRFLGTVVLSVPPSCPSPPDPQERKSTPPPQSSESLAHSSALEECLHLQIGDIHGVSLGKVDDQSNGSVEQADDAEDDGLASLVNITLSPLLLDYPSPAGDWHESLMSHLRA